MELDLIQQIRDQARGLLESEEVTCVIGYERASDGVTARPFFVYQPGDVSRLIFDQTCTHNLAKYLLNKRNEKVAIVVKPCDSRAINLLINEGQIQRDKVFVIGINCPGVVDVGWNQAGQTLQARCNTCQQRKPVVYDLLVGPEPAELPAPDSYLDVSEVEAKPTAERRTLWLEQFQRCIRCYACRQVCPGCYCEECFVEQLDPLWVGIKIAPNENEMWQAVRAFHLAGRCIGCNECERVCPVGLRLSLINRKLEKEVGELFGFRAGMNAEEEAPLTTFKKEESLGFEE